MEHIHCLLCGQDNWRSLFQSRDFLHELPGIFTVAKCQNCGFVATNPRPDAEEIGAYYPEEYGPYQLNKPWVEKTVRLRKKHPTLYSLVDPRIFYVAKEREWEKPLNILEIGCGAGNFLYELKLRFPNWNLKGTDFSQSSITRLQEEGIKGYVSDLRKLEENDRSVDVVYGYMILEHLHFIEETLSEVKRLLKDDGKLVVAVPNIKSWQFFLFQKYAYILHLPAHLYHFTEKTVTQVLERNGFSVEKVIYHRSLQDSSFSLCNWVRESKLPKGLQKFILRIASWKTAYHFLLLPLTYLQAWTKQSPGITLICRKTLL